MHDVYNIVLSWWIWPRIRAIHFFSRSMEKPCVVSSLSVFVHRYIWITQVQEGNVVIQLRGGKDIYCVCMIMCGDSWRAPRFLNSSIRHWHCIPASMANCESWISKRPSTAEARLSFLLSPISINFLLCSTLVCHAFIAIKSFLSSLKNNREGT